MLQRAQQNIAAARRVPDSKLIDRGFVEATIFQIGARDLALRRAFELLREKRLRYAMHLDQRGALLVFFAFFGRALSGLRDCDAAFLRDDPNRFRERALFHFHDEFEDVAADTAAEAVVNLFGGMHSERRRLFRVERAQAREILAALFQAHVFADNADDVRLLLYAIRE